MSATATSPRPSSGSVMTMPCTLRGRSRCAARSTSTCSRARRCAATRSATRTSGRSGSTRRPPTPAARPCTSSRASPASSTCGAIASPSGRRSSSCSTRPTWTHASSSWTRGPPSAARSSSTPPGAAATTPTSATRSSRSSTSATRRTACAAWPGKSSGGYGAAVTAMLRPDLFHGFASHAGGGLFDVSIRPFFRVAARRLRDAYGGSVERFLAELRDRPGAARASRRPPRPAPVGLRRRLLRRRGRDRPPPVRRRDRGGDPGALGALARVGLPDARAPARRRAPQPARDLRRLRHARRVVPRPDRRVAAPRV